MSGVGGGSGMGWVVVIRELSMWEVFFMVELFIWSFTILQL